MSGVMNDALATVIVDLPWLRKLAARLACGDAGEADELVQQTLEVVVRHAPDLQRRGARGWLATVLRNRWKMGRRAANRRAAREQAAAEPHTPVEPTDELVRVELLGFVLARIQGLDELDRKIVTLRYLDELEPATIAARLAMPSATVRSRLHRALARLRAELDAHCGDRRWALVLAGHMPLRTSAGAGVVANVSVSGMTAAIGAPLAVALVVATWIALDPPTRPGPASSQAPLSTPRPVTPARPPAWDQPAVLGEASPAPRFAGVREEATASAAWSSTLDRAAAIEGAKRALAEFYDACADDLGTARGRLIVRGEIVGSPDVGTFFTALASVEPEVDDPAALECLIESVLGFRGPAPREPLVATTTMSFLGEMPQGMDPEAWTLAMFDAVIWAHLDELDACDASDEPAGSLRLQFEFGEGPQPTAVRTDGSDVAGPFARCAAALAASWRFPRKLAGARLEHALEFPLEPLPPL